MLDEQEPSVQSWEQVGSWGNMYLPKHGKCSSQHLYVKINSGFHARMRKNKFQTTRSENNRVQWSFIQQKAHLCFRPCSQDNTLNRSSSAWESLNIRKKLGRFVFFRGHLATYRIFPQFVSNRYEWVGGSSTLVFKIWHMKYHFLLKSYLVLRKQC